MPLKVLEGTQQRNAFIIPQIIVITISDTSASLDLPQRFGMDPSEYPFGRSPRKELQGPRPPALKVRKDSHKIVKKPPVAPPQQQQQQQQPRQPVIIYTVSPKVIHTNPSEFMNLVQRLTGSNSTSRSTSLPRPTTSANPFNDEGGAISPAARLATIENAKSPKEKKQQFGDVEGVDMGQVVERSSLCPGILSPGPASLPQISPNFFSSLPPDPNSVSFIHDLSPVLHSNRNFIEGSFMPSPSPFFSPSIISPNSSVDLFNNFNNFFDL